MVRFYGDIKALMRLADAKIWLWIVYMCPSLYGYREIKIFIVPFRSLICSRCAPVQ